MVYRGAVLNQLLIRQNCLLTYLNSNLSHKANAADYALINLAGMNFLYDQNNNTVGFQWLFGANKEYGYAINISTANGGMQFYYLNNGIWMPSWNK